MAHKAAAAAAQRGDDKQRLSSSQRLESLEGAATKEDLGCHSDRVGADGNGSRPTTQMHRAFEFFHAISVYRLLETRTNSVRSTIVGSDK